MKNIRFILGVLLTSVILAGHADAQETVHYKYNPSGNRTDRYLVKLPPETPGGDQIGEQELKHVEQEPEYSEVLNDHTITIFPNPNGGQFEVQITNLAEVKEFSITLYTMDGKEVYSGNEARELTHINIKDKEHGTYLLNVMLDGELSSWKVIKQ